MTHNRVGLPPQGLLETKAALLREAEAYAASYLNSTDSVAIESGHKALLEAYRAYRASCAEWHEAKGV